jgi:hypothetical protein
MKRTPQQIYDYESMRIQEYNQKLEIILNMINNDDLKDEIKKLFKWYGNARAIKSKAYQEIKKQNGGNK